MTGLAQLACVLLVVAAVVCVVLGLIIQERDRHQ